jgi:UDP-N-acetyl-2-amino-2-deoxyglucuronate dehydrogenase
MTSTKIKFAVSGFGHIGRRHATIINEYPDSELVAVIDTNSKAKEHELFPEGVPFFTSIEEFFASGIKADVVNVATPNGFHCPHAIMALENGL